MRTIEYLRFERPPQTWTTEPLPTLQDGEPIGLDFEYRPHDDPTRSKPISFSIYRPATGKSHHVPFRYEGGGNIDEAVAHRYFQDSMKNRHFYALNAKAEVHSAFNWGHDCDELDIHPHDVAFPATLLNEDRKRGFSLEALAAEYLPPEERKVHGEEDPAKFYLCHAGEVAPRCDSDARLAYRIHEVTRPQIEAEGLVRVNDVEDDCIMPVVGMERAGVLIDRPKLERWDVEIDQAIQAKFDYVYKETGVALVNNGERVWDQLFAKLGLEKPIIYNDKKQMDEATYNAEGLKSLAFVEGNLLKGVTNPILAAAFDIRRLRSMKSKYFTKFLNAIDSNNVLRYPLHQLRSTDELDDGSGYGAVTGRFSCGGNEWKVNIQQWMKAEKQLEEMGPDFIVRELAIAEAGMMMGASDASQIEFRFFSHYAAVLGYPGTSLAYARNPMEDFHLLVTIMMNPGISDKQKLKALRKHMKHNNFGVLYGMGRPKLARRLGLPCTCGLDWHEQEWSERRECYVKVRYFGQNKFHLPNCRARLANDIMDEYDKEFPEARILLEKASERARVRGYVEDIIGRRSRFPGGERLHKALNSVIQPSAASYFKMKLAELHRNRKTLQIKLRAPVHDEFLYDIDPGQLELKNGIWVGPKMQECLDGQLLPLRVPLLWESGFGNNWREANGK